MTLPINILQSLISRNRTVITGQHELVRFWKDVTKNNPTDCGYVNYCLKQADDISKDIAKLVLVQKTLKKEMVTALFHAGISRRINRNKELCMAAAGETF